MMKNVKAFPHREWIDSDDPSVFNPFEHPGMDLRDYFAINSNIATTYYLASDSVIDFAPELTGKPLPKDYPYGIESFEYNLEIHAAIRYKFADAMMKAREKCEN